MSDKYSINGGRDCSFKSLPNVFQYIVKHYACTHSDYLIQHCYPDFNTYHVTDIANNVLADFDLHADEIREKVSKLILMALWKEIQFMLPVLSKEFNRKIELFDEDYTVGMIFSSLFQAVCVNTTVQYLLGESGIKQTKYITSYIDLCCVCGHPVNFQFRFNVEKSQKLLSHTDYLYAYTHNNYQQEKQETESFLQAITDKITVIIYKFLYEMKWKLFDFSSNIYLDCNVRYMKRQFKSMSSTDICACARYLLGTYHDDYKSLKVMSAMFMSLANDLHYYDLIAVVLDRMHRYCPDFIVENEMEL